MITWNTDEVGSNCLDLSCVYILSLTHWANKACTLQTQPSPTTGLSIFQPQEDSSLSSSTFVHDQQPAHHPSYITWVQVLNSFMPHLLQTDTSIKKSALDHDDIADCSFYCHDCIKRMLETLRHRTWGICLKTSVWPSFSIVRDVYILQGSNIEGCCKNGKAHVWRK